MTYYVSSGTLNLTKPKGTNNVEVNVSTLLLFIAYAVYRILSMTGIYVIQLCYRAHTHGRIVMREPGPGRVGWGGGKSPLALSYRDTCVIIIIFVYL